MHMAQVLALLSMAAILTVLARTLSLAAFGVFGLVSSFVTYLLVVQGAVTGATMQILGGANSAAERDRAFTTAFLVLAFLGLMAGAVIGGGGVALLGALHIPARLRPDARDGILALAVVTFIGWPARTFADALRGLHQFVLASVCEAVAYVLYTALMLVLVLVVKPPLWVLIAAGGTGPAIIGVLSGVALVVGDVSVRLRPAAVDLADARGFLNVSFALLTISGADILISSLDRTVLGLFRPASTVALYEGAVRPTLVIRTLAGSMVRTVVPASAQFHALADLERLRALLIRGTRYVLAGTLPITIVLTVLAGPILEVWLGKRYERAATALAIFAGAWITGANGSVIGSALVGVGSQRRLVGYTWGAALLNLALSVGLTPVIGLNGVVVGTTASYVALFPLLLRIAVTTLHISLGDLIREVWVPAYSLGAVLAVVLVALRLTAAPDTLASVAVTGIVSVLAYWLAFYALCLRPDERVLIKSLLRRRGRPLEAPRTADAVS